MIKILSFDIDGTLIDKNLDFILWNIEVPKIYAEERKISIEEAENRVFAEYYRGAFIDKTPYWADIEYWFSRLCLKDWGSLLNKLKKDIKLFEDVPPALSRLKEKYILVATSLNSKLLMETKLKASGLEKYFERAFYSESYTPGNSEMRSKNDKSLFFHILEEMDAEPKEVLHVGDNISNDVIIPSSIGMHAVLIDRNGEKRIEGHPVIKSLLDLEKLLEGNYENG